MRKIVSGLIVLFACVLPAFAGETADSLKSPVRRNIDFVAEFLLDRQYKGIDTTFIHVPGQQWAVRGFTNFTGNAIGFNRKRFFAALRGTIHYCPTGNARILQITYFRANGRLCVGWRF